MSRVAGRGCRLVVWRLRVFAVGFIERAVPSPLVEVRVLGPVELVDGASAVRLPPAERTLLAALAARLGERVPVDVLVEALWPDGSAAVGAQVAAGAHRAFASALGAAAIVERDGGYRLDPELVEVDATRVTQLVEQAREACAVAMPRWPSALLGDARAIVPRRAVRRTCPRRRCRRARCNGCVELRAAIVEDGAEAELEPRPGERCVGELEAFVQANPYRERAWGLLMRALYQAGRPGRRARRVRPGPGAARRRAGDRARPGAARRRAGDPHPRSTADADAQPASPLGLGRRTCPPR